MWKDVAAGFLDVLAPRGCAGCDERLLPEERGFCGGCALLFDEAGTAWAPPAPAACLYLYGGPIRDAIRRMKYGGRSDLAGVLGALLARAAPAYGGHIDAIVPVPLHPRRLRERGFDQATLIAAPLARALSVKLDLGRLRRVRHTPAQAGLEASARVPNVRGAFRSRVDPKRPRVLLVDDVRTTGATMAACAEALREAGAAEIYTLTLARAP